MSIFDFFRGEKPLDEEAEQIVIEDNSIYSTHRQFKDKKENIEAIVFPNMHAIEAMHNNAAGILSNGLANDSAANGFDIKSIFSLKDSRVPDVLMSWYARQGFIGYQACAMIAQHWLVNKACEAPPKDAFRNGWKLTSEEVAPEVLKALEGRDKEYKILENVLQFAKFNRVFGIRIAIFKVDGVDYTQPFNIATVTKNSYRGIAQVDPYWCIPELKPENVADPATVNFYEPEYWTIAGVKYHKSWLCVIRYAEVPDILKPAYLYGGMSLVQMLYERVYCAERSANEMPQLLMTKRMNVEKTDLKRIVSDPIGFRNRVEDGIFLRDNYGIKFIGKDDEYSQHETSLADADVVVMSEFQLVASVANMPATRLIEMQPKGFNTSGENEQRNYRQYLKTIQSHEGTELVERHYQLLLKSDFDLEGDLSIIWNPTDDPTSDELAEINLKKANYYAALQATGAVSADDIAKALNEDDASGFMDVEPEEGDDPFADLLGGQEDPKPSSQSFDGLANDEYIEDPDGFFKSRKGKTIAYKNGRLSGIEGEYLAEKKMGRAFVKNVNGTHGAGGVPSNTTDPNKKDNVVNKDENLTEAEQKDRAEKMRKIKEALDNSGAECLGEIRVESNEEVLAKINEIFPLSGQKMGDDAHEVAHMEFTNGDPLIDILGKYTKDLAAGFSRDLNVTSRKYFGKFEKIPDDTIRGAAIAIREMFKHYHGIDEKIRAFRGVPSSVLQEIIKSKEYKDAAFTSYSTKESVSRGYYRNGDGFVMVTDMIESTKAISLLNVSTTKQQSEILVNSGESFKFSWKYAIINDMVYLRMG